MLDVFLELWQTGLIDLYLILTSPGTLMDAIDVTQDISKEKF